MSLDSPPPPPPAPLHGPSQLDLVSRGGDVTKEAAAAAAAAAAAVHAEYAAAAAFASSQRAPGSHLAIRNGSITPPFEENGVASPIEAHAALALLPKAGASSPSSASSSSSASSNSNQGHAGGGGGGGSSSITGLSTSMDSAPPVMQHHGYPKNRFFSGDHANSRETLMRRQIYSIGKKE